MDPLSAARAAHAQQDWQTCFDVLSDVDTSALSAGDEAERLDLLAEVGWWLGRLDDCIDARERAYRAFDELGDPRRAGQCAVWLYEHHNFRASPSIAGGWLRRARRALEGLEDTTEFGALLLREAEVAHGSGRLDEAAALAERGIGLGRKLRSADLEAESLQTLGRVRIDQGRPGDGLALLDEAMLLLHDGRLSAYSTGKVYCSLISACEQLSDHGRASEWINATARWAQRNPFAVFPGLCRVHHATALQLRGDWAEAEQEAARACRELAEINLPNAAAAWAEVGGIRRRLGDLDGAMLAFENADRLCPQPRAGLALLRLDQGKVEEAMSIINEVVEAAGWNRLARASALPARAQIAVAAGEMKIAANAADELDEIAREFDSAGLRAAAASVRGRVQLAAEDPDACSTLRDAVARWSDLGAPYEVATARMLLGRACHDRGDLAGSSAAFETGTEELGRLGVRVDGRGADLAPRPPALPAGLTEREVQVLRLVAAGLTNKEVAAALYLSDKTIARHLANIFTKIGASTRAGATAFAFENDLILRG